MCYPILDICNLSNAFTHLSHHIFTTLCHFFQGRENTEGSLIDRAVLDLLYPKYYSTSPGEEGTPLTCGYAAETGGKLSNLRTLDIHKIRRYHKEYYRADNVLILVSGNVDSEEFFNKLDEVEDLVLSRQCDGDIGANDEGERTRPWIHSFVPEMESNVVGVYPPYSSTAAMMDDDDGLSTKPKPLIINFPSEDESRGTISIAWRGPPYSSRSTWAHLSCD